MKTNRAFTLIEVMVVLSILAIIAILAYNFFGSTMREAKNKQMATKVYNDMRTITDAITLYLIDNPSDDILNTGSMKPAVLAVGKIREWPTPPSEWDNNAGLYDYEYTFSWVDLGGPSATADTTLDWYEITQEGCEAITNQYTDFAQPWSITKANGEATTYPVGTSFWCEAWEDGTYSVVMVMNLK